MRHGLWHALRHRNFALFMSGRLILMIGTWMQPVAQAWPVFRRTGSALLLGGEAARLVREVLHGQDPATANGRARWFFMTRFRRAGRRWSLGSLEKMIRAQGDPRVWYLNGAQQASRPPCRRSG